MNADSETRLTDILVEKKIDDDLICRILTSSFNLNEDSVLVLPWECEAHGIDFSSIHCLCDVHEVRGDVSLLLTVCRYAISNDLALRCLIRNFMKFGISSYFAKDNFDDFYHVAESGSLVIATQVYGDDDDAGVYHFEITGSYDGSLGDSFFG